MLAVTGWRERPDTPLSLPDNYLPSSLICHDLQSGNPLPTSLLPGYPGPCLPLYNDISSTCHSKQPKVIIRTRQKSPSTLQYYSGPGERSKVRILIALDLCAWCHGNGWRSLFIRTCKRRTCMSAEKKNEINKCLLPITQTTPVFYLPPGLPPSFTRPLGYPRLLPAPWATPVFYPPPGLPPSFTCPLGYPRLLPAPWATPVFYPPPGLHLYFTCLVSHIFSPVFLLY